MISAGADDEQDIWASKNKFYWDNTAASYDSLYRSEWHELENEVTSEDLRTIMASYDQPHVLDLACGTGLGFRLLRYGGSAASSRNYLGVDVSENMLGEFRGHYPEARVVHASAIDFLHANPERFDLVMSLFTSGSFLSPQIETTVDAAFRSLKPRGSLYISFLGRHSPHELARYGNRRHISYSTRGKTDSGTPAVRVGRRELLKIARRTGVGGARVHSLGPLVGWLEMPALFSLNSKLRFLPLAHTLVLIGKRQ